MFALWYRRPLWPGKRRFGTRLAGCRPKQAFELTNRRLCGAPLSVELQGRIIRTMKTPYIPHFFGADAIDRVEGRVGWLTVGVVSSIAWPQDDVWVEYDGAEYLLLGVDAEREHHNSPCIVTPTGRDEIDAALSRVYRFASVLGYFKRGYVDITGQVWGSRIVRYANPHDTFTTLTQAGKKGFNCNHMPIIEDDQVRKALAFLREGQRLRHVHEPYSFLSFFKVIESQFTSEDRKDWVSKNLDALDGEAAKRISALRAEGIDVNHHLYQSGRCAVAHASVGGNIIDPDIPTDRKRIAADLDIISALARRYVKVDAAVPDEMDLYASRDRVAPWYALMTPRAVSVLKAGGHLQSVEELGKLEGAKVSIRLWPDPPAKQFQAMTLLPMECGHGVVKFLALNARETVVLVFAMDVANGRMHTVLNEGGMPADADVTEEDVEDYTRYFHSVIGNRVVELTIDGAEPVDCEVVIPVNIIPRAPEEAVAQAIEQFRRSKS